MFMAQVDSSLQKGAGGSASPARGKRSVNPSRLLRTPPSLLIVVALFGISLGFDLYRLGVPSIWFDEAFSVELARQPLPLLWHIIFGSEPNMELYYLLLHGWLAVTGMLGQH